MDVHWLGMPGPAPVDLLVLDRPLDFAAPLGVVSLPRPSGRFLLPSYGLSILCESP